MPESRTESDIKTGARFPCKDCGALLEYAPGTDVLTCPYCGAHNEIPKTDAVVAEQDFLAELDALAGASEKEEHATLKCDACAAEFQPPPNVTATDCPFCGFHLNITTRTSRLIKPACLLPFKITREAAKASFFKWLGGLWFAPSRLKRFAESDSKLSGMYVPSWTYDSDTTSRYTGERGDAYYVTVGSGKNRRTERRIRWTSVSGSVFVRFDDVLVLASRSLPDKQARNLEPWDLKALVPYDDAYLAGFGSECYQIDLKQGFEIARRIMDERIREAIRRDIGGDEQRIHSVDTRHAKITFKHILLPVWISAYRFQSRVFRFLVNARTGEVQGERPFSAWKIASAVIVGLIIAGIIVIIASRN